MCAWARSSWPGRARWPPGRVLVRLIFPLAVLSRCFALPPPGCGCPCCGSFFCFPFCFSFFFFVACLPALSGFLCFLARGALGLGALVFFCSLPRPAPPFLLFRPCCIASFFLVPPPSQPPPWPPPLFCFFLFSVFFGGVFFGGGALGSGGFLCSVVPPWGLRPPLLCVRWCCCCAMCFILLARCSVYPWSSLVPCCCAVHGVCQVFCPCVTASRGAFFACAPRPRPSPVLTFVLSCCCAVCVCPLAFVLVGSALCCSDVVVCSACWPCSTVSCGALAWCAVWCAPPPPRAVPFGGLFCAVPCYRCLGVRAVVLCGGRVVACCCAPLVRSFLCGVLSLVPWCLGLLWAVLCCPRILSVLRCAGLVLWCRAVRCAALLCCRGSQCFCWCPAGPWCAVLFGALLRCLWYRRVLLRAVVCSFGLCGVVVRCSICVPLCGVELCWFSCAVRPCPPPHPPPLLLPLLVGCAVRPVVFCRVLLRVWCCAAPRQCSRLLLPVLLCAVAFTWCGCVLLRAVLLLLVFCGFVALLCGAMRLGALVWFAVFFCAPLVLLCLAVWCAAVLCCLWLLRFCCCLAVSWCAVLYGACLRARGTVVCCCALWRLFSAYAVSRCAVSSGVLLCRAALCWFCRPVQPCHPHSCCWPCRLAVPCVMSCFPVSCFACSAVLPCAGALVLAVPLGLCCCHCPVLWCVEVRCAVASGVVWCGGVALLCGVVCLAALVFAAVALSCCVASRRCAAWVCCGFSFLFVVISLFLSKTSAVCFDQCFVV